MNNKNYINTKMDEGLQILGKIDRAQPDEGLYERILQKMRIKPARIPSSRLWLAAACIAGLMAINIWTIETKGPMANNNNTTVKVVADSYFGYAHSQNLYP